MTQEVMPHMMKMTGAGEKGGPPMPEMLTASAVEETQAKALPDFRRSLAIASSSCATRSYHP
jgi:hypothetical protein